MAQCHVHSFLSGKGIWRVSAWEFEPGYFQTVNVAWISNA